jgi:nitroreductase/NAD-dependent dihydropyrimidine dehydrogenase PreA subunit
MAVEKKEVKQDKVNLLKNLEENFTETEKVILSRRSTRWYKKEQVPEFMVKRILEAGRFAPTAGNFQSWKFIVIREPKLIEDFTNSLVMICKLFKAILEYRTPGNFWKMPIAKLYTFLMPAKLSPVPFSAISLIADRKLDLYHGAPTVILICKDVRGVSNPDLDCGIAGQNMVLAAHSMGLGTCWISFAKVVFDYLGFKWNKVFGIKYPYKFITSLAIGWPMGKPNGFVERPAHSVNWFENGAKTVVDPNKEESSISVGERFSIPNYMDPGQTHWGELFFDYDKCNGCGSCERICPASSIELKDKKPMMADGGGCMACGDCIAICPQEAIRMKSSYRFSQYFKTIDHSDLKLPRLK